MVKTRTIRMPDHLDQQIQDLATVTHRSYSSQAVVLLEQAINGAVEADLLLIQQMRARGAQNAGTAPAAEAVS